MLKKIKYIAFILAALVVIILILENTAMLFFPVKYKGLVDQYSTEYDIDPYLVLAIIKTESNFKSEAISHKNARGLMQISEGTGKWGAERLKLENYSHEMLYKPEINIQIGCWYLSVLHREFKDIDLVLAAYNGGSGNVWQWLKNSEFSADGKKLDKIPFKETERYLKKVKNSYIIYKRVYENEF